MGAWQVTTYLCGACIGLHIKLMFKEAVMSCLHVDEAVLSCLHAGEAVLSCLHADEAVMFLPVCL